MKAAIRQAENRLLGWRPGSQCKRLISTSTFVNHTFAWPFAQSILRCCFNNSPEDWQRLDWEILRDGGIAHTHVHRTYTVKTSTRVFVLECPYWMDGFHIHSASECGGKKKIEIGDPIRFRVEKARACVLTAEGKEQKLRVVSEGMKEAGNTVPAPSQEP